MDGNASWIVYMCEGLVATMRTDGLFTSNSQKKTKKRVSAEDVRRECTELEMQVRTGRANTRAS